MERRQTISVLTFLDTSVLWFQSVKAFVNTTGQHFLNGIVVGNA